MRAHRASMACLLLVMATVSGCSRDGTSDAATETPTDRPDTVTLKLLAFQPAQLTVPTGTTVTWTNDEPIRHTVTSGAVTGVDAQTGLRSGEDADGRFDRTLSSKGQTFSHRFTEPGTYSYFCSIHRGMNATVVVTP